MREGLKLALLPRGHVDPRQGRLDRRARGSGRAGDAGRCGIRVWQSVPHEKLDALEEIGLALRASARPPARSAT